LKSTRPFCILLEATLNVQENMSESHSGQSQIQVAQSKPKGKYTGERIKPAKLQAIVNALSIGEPIQSIAARLHSSTSTVIATRERESLDIERRKQLIRASAARLAANGFDKLNREMDAGKINGALLVPVTGMATDKVIALSLPAPFPSSYQQNLHLHLQPVESPATLIECSANSKRKPANSGSSKRKPALSCHHKRRQKKEPQIHPSPQIPQTVPRRHTLASKRLLEQQAVQRLPQAALR
jgi:hypothetical protein